MSLYISKQVTIWILLVFFTIFWFLIALPSAMNGSGFLIFGAFVVTAIWIGFGLPYIIRRWRPVKEYFGSLYRD